MAIIRFFILTVVIALTSAQSPHTGKCPEKTPVQNFDLDKYLGLWYEIKRYHVIFEAGGDCVTANYTMLPSGEVQVTNNQTNLLLETKSGIVGTAKPASTTGEAKLTVTFSIPVVGDRSAPYWVLATDYQNYAVVWSCEEVLRLTNFQSAWVLSRTPSMTDSTAAAVQEQIAKFELTGDFRITDQDSNKCGW